MALIRPQTRIQRPAGRSEILLSQPLNRALCFAAVADSAQGFDLISRSAAALTASDSYVPSPMGPSWKFTASTANSGLDFGTFNPISTSDGAGAGDFTILAFGNPAAGAGVNTLIDQRKGTANFEQIGLFANSTKALSASSGLMSLITANTSNVSAGAQSVAGVVDGLPHVWVGRRLGTAHSIWRDGTDVTGSSDTSASTVWSTAQQFEIGGAAGFSDPSFGGNCNVVLCLAWNRALSDVEMLSIGRNPWQLFKAIQPRIFGAGQAAAGGAVLSRYYYDQHIGRAA